MIKNLNKQILTSRKSRLALIFQNEKGDYEVVDVRGKLDDLDLEYYLLQAIEEAVIQNIDITQIEKMIGLSGYLMMDLIDGYSDDKQSRERIIERIQVEIEECRKIKARLKHLMMIASNHIVGRTKNGLTRGKLKKIANQNKN